MKRHSRRLPRLLLRPGEAARAISSEVGIVVSPQWVAARVRGVRESWEVARGSLGLPEPLGAMRGTQAGVVEAPEESTVEDPRRRRRGS